MRTVVLLIFCFSTWNGFCQVQDPFQRVLHRFDRLKIDSPFRGKSGALDSVTVARIKYRTDSLRLLESRYALSYQDTLELTSRLDTLIGVRSRMADSIRSANLGLGENQIPGEAGEIAPKLPGGNEVEGNAVPELKTISVGSEMVQLPTAVVPALNIPKEIQDNGDDIQDLLPNAESLSVGIDDPVTELTNAIPDDIGAYQDIEGKITELSGAPKIQDPQVMKEMALNKAKETATNHFKGHEQQLIEAMARFAEARSKIKEPEGVIDMLAKRLNSLKSKKLKERLIGGMMFQHQQMNGLLVDINPFCLYRFTHYLNGGLGWNQRIAFDKWSVQPDGRIFGPRSTVELNLKSFAFLVLDAELMNTRRRSLGHATEKHDRIWVASYFGGIRTKFRISKSLIGHTSLLYNLLDRSYQSPYADKLNVRFGFEVFREK